MKSLEEMTPKEREDMFKSYWKGDSSYFYNHRHFDDFQKIGIKCKKSFYEHSDPKELNIIHSEIDEYVKKNTDGTNVNGISIGKKSCNHTLSVLKKYIECLQNYENEYLFYLTEFSNAKKTKRKNIKHNMLFYGVPGAGKSHRINEMINGNDYERVVFHPDYTYSDFVGQILPQKDAEGIKYNFVAGPFTRILQKSLNALKEANSSNAENENEGENEKQEQKNYFLIIEEINRGNAPAIFGDIFQLLDRNEEGESKYRITNHEIAEIVYGENKGDEKIYLPANLYILATMNTSDQNVFTLDTAFKRRWSMRCIRNDFGKCDFADNNIANTNIKWGAFAEVINNKISETSNGISGEDKRLGAFFVTADELSDREAFGEKVLMYLWDDAFKYSREAVFRDEYKTLEAVLDDFENYGFQKTNSPKTDESNTPETAPENEEDNGETEGITAVTAQRAEEGYYVFKDEIVKAMINYKRG